ncbi:hypothetical protein B0H14DRAFT_3583530 [Mycena olivaceomarginata]|nr:hypothetical protein B0H14DRAFT_3583530 [Mycena olivaceomarginata]
MKLLSSALFLGGLSLSSATSAKYGVRRGDQEPLIYVPLVPADEYASGMVHMAMMATLTVYPLQRWLRRQRQNNTYSRRNLDLYSFTPHGLMGSTTDLGNDIWGWVHTSDGVSREFGLIGQFWGTTFVTFHGTACVSGPLTHTD